MHADFPGIRIEWLPEETRVWASSARLLRERAGAERVPELSPLVKEVREEVLIYEATLHAEGGWGGEGRWEERQGSIRELLLWLGSFYPVGSPNVLKALGAKLQRSRLDRALAQPWKARFALGPVSLGGAWGRTTEGRTVALVLEGACKEAPLALDFLGEGTADENGRALVRLLRDAFSPELPVDLSPFLPPSTHLPQNQLFRLVLKGPPFLSLAPEYPGTTASDVPFETALRLLRRLHNTYVGGVSVQLLCEPPLQKPAFQPVQEPQDHRRRRLFRRWFEGILADEEGLFSATPEAIASDLARRLSGPVIDGTTGIGCLAIACAQVPSITQIWAIDKDKKRLSMARHNAEVYEVSVRIRFLQGDLLTLLPKFPAEATLLLDPPWGGRDYDRQRMELSDLGMDLQPIFRAFPGPIVLKLPRSFATETLPAFRFEIAGDLKFLWAFRQDQRG